MKTLAAVLNKINEPLEIEELLVPDLKPGQVLVKVAFSGLCHSQLNEIRGKKGPDKFLPHTLGHEGAGVVEATGEGVNKIKAGDRVLLTWIKGVGADVSATQYKRGNGTVVNSGAISTFLTYAVIAENRLVKIAPEMPLDVASLLGCAVSTGMGSVINIAKLKEGETLAVYGAGGIGLSAIHAASINKAAMVIAIDAQEEKLRLAKELGATHTINAKTTDPVRSVIELTGGRGADYAIESAGLKETMENSFRSVRNNGGKAIIVGNLPAGQNISLDPFLLICGRQIVGSWGGNTDPDKDIPKYVDMYISGKLKLDKMLSHRFKLGEIDQAFKVLEEGKAGRVIIETCT